MSDGLRSADEIPMHPASADDEAALAAALEALPHLILVIPPADFECFMEALRRRAEARGSRKLRMSDADEPPGAGLDEEGGFVPCLFTSEQPARAYAARSGLIGKGVPLPLLRRPPAARLRSCLLNGHPAALLDPGTARERRVERASLARVYALLTRQEFLARPGLRLVERDGELYRVAGPTGPRAWVFESARAAVQGLPALHALASNLEARPIQGQALLERLVEGDVAELVVDPLLPTRRSYQRGDLLRMRRESDARSCAS